MTIRKSHLLSVVLVCFAVAALCLGALLSTACTPPAEGQPPQFAVTVVGAMLVLQLVTRLPWNSDSDD